MESSTMTAGEEMFFGTFIMALFFIMLAIAIASLVAMWRLFEKAGEAGWKAIVPVYNSWVFLRLGNQPGWLILLAFIPVVQLVTVVFLAIAAYNIGLKLAKPSWYVILYLFLPVVWLLILAFDSSVWNARAAGVVTSSDEPHSPPVFTPRTSDTATTPETKPPAEL